MVKLGQRHDRQGLPPLIVGILVSCLLVLALVSCSRDGVNCPERCALPSGRAVVDASVRVDEFGRFYIEAFSFSAGGTFRYPSDEGIEPDFILAFLGGASGDIQGLFLAQLDVAPAFHRVGRGATMEAGRVLFDEATCIPEDASFETLVGPAEPYQVWVIRTRDGKFGKVLVVDRFFCSQEYDSAGITVSRVYGEITVDWQYQPDGSKCFE